ncbi:MAG: thiolase family protein [Planctomycetes bacterium]|nr:thiolase family protein [Planctomycetota bacterium]NOG53704.1 thiolase family protein [Planctomycetota bacterium]
MAKSEKSSVVIAGAARTPIGIKCGTLSSFAPEDLAVLAANEAISRSGVNAEEIDAAIGANVYQFTAPHTQDLYFPRNVGLRCGLRTETPALMVQRICGSGMQTVINAWQQIAMPPELDDASVILCFAAEAMSRCPRINRAPRRSGAEFWDFEQDGQVEDTILASLDHTLADTSMMRTADEYAAGVGVTRAECDAFAVESHSRALAAAAQSHFNNGDGLRGMFAVDTTAPDGQPVYLARDESARATTLETISRLPGLTKNKLVSPGNASEIGDGAGAIVAADRARAEALGLPCQFELVSYGVAGVEPRIMGQGPVPSIEQALARAGLKKDDIDLWEINEAFAAQYLGVEKELGLDRSTVNVNGGAVAIGHPLAATGVRLITDVMYEMDRRGVKYGCASACIGGGQGAAVILRNTAVK